MLFREFSTAVVILQLFRAFKVALAQTSSVSCPASYNWAENSLGQNPCLISAFLLRPCSNSVVDVPILPVGQHYDPGDYSDCNCNTVVYSLVSACADCQSRTYDLWTLWSVNCTNVYRGLYPHAIPSGTAVPAWAYLDVLTGNTYNATAAMADISSPESTAFVPTPTSTSGPTSSSFTTSSSPSPTAPTPKPQKTNVGAIAGGAAGGFVVVALILFAMAWLCKRSRRPVAPVAEYKVHNGGVDKITPMSPPPPSNPYDLTATQYSVPVYPQPKLYDPSDPSTFPTAQMPSSPQMGYSSVPQSPSSQSPYPTSLQTLTPPLSQSSYTPPSLHSAYISPSLQSAYTLPPGYQVAPDYTGVPQI